MIEYYRKIGLRMYKVRYLLIALVIAFSATSVALLFADVATSERFLLPSMVLTTWFILCLSLAYYFAGLEANAHSPVGVLERIAHAIRRAFTYLLALLFTLVSLTLLYFTSTAIRLAATG